MALLRLKYVSRASRPMTTAAVTALIRHAQTKNARLGVTGILLNTGGLFYQIIEGLENDISALYQTIEADPRHTDVLVLDRRHVASRLFPDWSMRLLSMGSLEDERQEPLRELLPTILELRLRADHLTTILERGILRELSERGE